MDFADWVLLLTPPWLFAIVAFINAGVFFIRWRRRWVSYDPDLMLVFALIFAAYGVAYVAVEIVSEPLTILFQALFRAIVAALLFGGTRANFVAYKQAKKGEKWKRWFHFWHSQYQSSASSIPPFQASGRLEADQKMR